MHCPSCSKPLEEATDACVHCGLSLALLDRHFGPVPRHNSVLTDWARLFNRKSLSRLNLRLRLLHRRFPQARFSIFTCHLPNRPAREYGFWLFNRCRFTEAGLRGSKSFGLLLLINTGNGEASITTGYGLERILSDRELQTALDAGAACFRAGDFEAGVRACLDTLAPVMERNATVAVATHRHEPLPDSTGLALEERVR